MHFSTHQNTAIFVEMSKIEKKFLLKELKYTITAWTEIFLWITGIYHEYNENKIETCSIEHSK